MPTAAPRYVTDDAGRRVAVLVDIDRYRELVEALDELDAVRAYDEAKASGDDALDFETVIRAINAGEEV